MENFFDKDKKRVFNQKPLWRIEVGGAADKQIPAKMCLSKDAKA